jgi:hypothetical protein
MPGKTGAISCVLGIAVTEVVLHSTQIRALMGKVIAAGVTEHVGPDAPELCSLASEPRDIIDAWRVSCACRSDTNSQGRLSSRLAR